MQFVQHRSCLSQLVLAKLGEVFRPRDLAGTITHGCDALDNLGKRAHCRIVSSVTRLSRWEIDFRLAVPSALAESAQIRHGPVSGRPAPKDPKSFVKRSQVLVPVDEQCPQRQIEIGATPDIDLAEGCGHIRHAPRVYIQTGGVKQAAEVQKIMEQVTHVEDSTWTVVAVIGTVKNRQDLLLVKCPMSVMRFIAQQTLDI